MFPNKGVLVVHQRAKHFGVHLDIKLNWHLWKYGSNSRSTSMNHVRNDDHGGEDADPRDGLPLLAGRETEMPCCPLCDCQFSMGMDELRHEIKFIPSSLVIARAMAQGITNSGVQA
jgi:hypothetical protein